MKNERAREFLFDPARFKNDPAVMAMSPAARGAYIILFCEGWDMPEPGVLPSSAGTLSMLARVDYETWLEVGGEVSTAYDTTSRPGFWVQRGTVQTHEAQKLWYDNAVANGRIGGLKAASNRPSKAQNRVPLPKGGKVREGEVLTEKEKEKASDSVPLTERSAETANPTPVGVQGPVAKATVNPRISDETYFERGKR